jgi:sterol desaturase/sphingolipid hydroxylase (fatty acid hydroxylase superfamily)
MVSMFGLLLLGVVSYSFIEYVHHRHGGHLARFGARLYVSHQTHHGDPTEGGVTYVQKVVQRAPLVAGVLAVFAVPAVSILGARGAIAFLVGLLTAYLWSEWYHHRMHHRPPTTAIGAWLRRFHYVHHFVDTKSNFGFTTPVWDFAFGTARVMDRVEVSARKAAGAVVSTPGVSVRPRQG